ncbi:MAG: GNAT family N-acetyltransferase [Hyphomicrobiales bacterium]|nr:GNAT family N-acetyltransferase [Hyphomicrobiales bacterium]
MQDLIIRPLDVNDETAWRRLWTGYLEFYETTVSEEVYKTAFSRLISGEPGEFHGLIAEVDGKPVGLAHYLFHRFLWTIEDTCYLMDLFVDPDIRGHGAGRRLIEAVHEKARQGGAAGIYWMTQEFNYKGRMLYDQVAAKTPFIVYEKNS